MRFEWDEKKNHINRKKHGVSFEEDQDVFSDPLHIAILDKRFHYFEERWITLGRTKTHTLLVVAHLYFDEHGEEVIRIISAREATRNEKNSYKKHGR